MLFLDFALLKVLTLLQMLMGNADGELFLSNSVWSQICIQCLGLPAWDLEWPLNFVII